MSDSPLKDIIDLEKLDTNLFRGKNYMAPWGALFGGQVLAQALNAVIGKKIETNMGVEFRTEI